MWLSKLVQSIKHYDKKTLLEITPLRTKLPKEIQTTSLQLKIPNNFKNKD
jgi:hypothetical protein